MGNFSDLPAEIVVDIFTRLPSESVLDCKSVSKTWRNVLHHPSFNQMHSNLLISNLGSTADSGKFSFIFRMYDQFLYYLEYDDGVSSHGVKKLKLKSPFESYSIVGSCNGLVCINGVPNHYTKDKFTWASYVAYICNPITGESITLPELDRSTYYGLVHYMLCGFGYVASANEYKVVRLYELLDVFVHIEVYTLGSGKGWRNVGKIHDDSKYIVTQPAVFVDGFLYWNFVKGRIHAFDLANEIFVELDEYWNGSLRNRVLGGHYSGIRFSKDGKSSDAWLLKKKKMSHLVQFNQYGSLHLFTCPY